MGVAVYMGVESIARLVNPATIRFDEAIPVAILGLAVTSWVAGFDIIYACQDAAFDAAHGLYSVPARLGVPRALRRAKWLHLVTLLVLAVLPAVVPQLGWIYWAALAAVSALLAWEHALVRPDDLSRVNQAFFTANAAIGVSWQIFLIVIVFMASLFTGQAVLVARFVGAGEPEKVNRTVYQAFLTAMAMYVFLMAPFGYFASPLLLDMVNAAPEVKALALPFLRINFVFAIGMMLFFMLSSALRAAGDARTPLFLGVSMTVLNLLLNLDDYFDGLIQTRPISRDLYSAVHSLSRYLSGRIGG
jgi:hypothetical protein